MASRHGHQKSAGGMAGFVHAVTNSNPAKLRGGPQSEDQPWEDQGRQGQTTQGHDAPFTHIRERFSSGNAPIDRQASAEAARLPSRHSKSRVDQVHNAASPRSTSLPRNDHMAMPLGQNWWDGSEADHTAFSDSASTINNHVGADQTVRLSQEELHYDPEEQRTVRPSGNGRIESGEFPFECDASGRIKAIRGPASIHMGQRARSSSKGAPYLDYDEQTLFPTDGRGTPPQSRGERGARMSARPANRELVAGEALIPMSRDGQPMTESYAHQSLAVSSSISPPDNTTFKAGHSRHLAHRPPAAESLEIPLDMRSVSEEDEGIDSQITPRPASGKPSEVRKLFSAASKKTNWALDSHESEIPHKNSHHEVPSSKKRQLELDYDEAVLSNMSYSQLKDQDFDFDPAQAEARSVEAPPQGSLSDKLEHFLGKDMDSQTSFFNTMPINDWDESGDWFLGRFGDIMARLKDSRRERRAVVSEFEEEVGRRESAVRGKMDGIAHTLEDFRNEGDRMMKGKDIE